MRAANLWDIMGVCGKKMNYDFSKTMNDGEKETLLAEIRNILEMEQKWLFTF